MADNVELQILIKARNDAKKELDGLNSQIKNLQGSTGLTGANSKLKEFGIGLNNVSKAVTGFDVTTLAATAGVGLLVREYQKAISGTMELAHQVRTLTRDIGATPEEASKLIQAADDVQVSFESLKTAMIMANKQGIDVTVAGMSALSEQYLAIQDPLDRTRFLTDTFGRSGEQLGALMELGAAGIEAAGIEAEKYGRILDESAIKQTEEFRIAQDNLDDSLGRMKDTLALEVIPALTSTLNIVTPVIQAYNSMKSALNSLDPALKGIITTFYGFLDPINMVLGPIKALYEAIVGLLGAINTLNGTSVNVPSMYTNWNPSVPSNKPKTAPKNTSVTVTSTGVNVGGSYYGTRASGGPVQAGKPYLVGEQGPEPFIPNTNGMILPNKSLGTTVNVYYQPVVSLSDRTEIRTKLIPLIKEAMRS